MMSAPRGFDLAEGEGLEPSSPKAPVFKTGGLPIILTLRCILRGCFLFASLLYPFFFPIFTSALIVLHY